jgi:predicted DNA-binding transcriptional regulator AlpA
MVNKKGIITGMKNIIEYSGLSEPTILYLIENASFPAKKTKLDSGTWISNTSAIDEWSRLFVMSKIQV